MELKSDDIALFLCAGLCSVASGGMLLVTLLAILFIRRLSAPGGGEVDESGEVDTGSGGNPTLSQMPEKERAVWERHNAKMRKYGYGDDQVV